MKACNQCGKCCIKYGANDLAASSEDIQWWYEHRPHIAEYIQDDQLWVHPISGQVVKQCPWLQVSTNHLYSCAIYYDRPEDCRLYPSTINEMIADKCEMLEPIDLLNLRRAHADLQQLMMDSR